jgi:putative peptide maturation dehydrogenase
MLADMPAPGPAMRLRRCHSLMVEPCERRQVDLDALIAGQPRLERVLGWSALAAHLDAPVDLDEAMLRVLGAVSPSQWTARADMDEAHPADALERLLAAGLLLRERDGGAHADADARVRDGHWRPLSAVAHRHLRWRGVDTSRSSAQANAGGEDAGSPRAKLGRLGPPPDPAFARSPPADRLRLPAPAAAGLDAVLRRRATCRNFDPHRPLALELLASVLQRVHGAQALSQVTGIPVLKKNAPSAGGLHPVEAYLLVRRVEGLAPGLYHYHCVDHALEPLTTLAPDAAEALARRFVAHQAWFVDAPVQVVLAARFKRTFWKYRNHAKAWRAVVLDAGHLSQLQYLVATELGLAAFVTAAVNEGDIEDAFGLDPMVEGVLAVTGFGHRAAAMAELEFDPLHAVWPPTAD